MLAHRFLYDVAPPDARPFRRTVMLASQGIPVALSVWYRHPEATTLLFYPGTMASPVMYTLLLNALWRQGLNVVALHPLSHGLSPCIKKDFTFADIVQNGLDAGRWAREHFSGPLVVAGHSQGGILTLAHAVRDPHVQAAFPLCALIPELEGAAAVTLFRRFERHKSMLQALLRGLAFMLPTLPVPMTAYISLRNAMKGHRQVVAPSRELRWTYPMSFVSSLFNLKLAEACAPGHIGCPLILFTANDDALFTLDLMRRTFACIAAPRKKLEVIHGGGHMFAVSRIFAPQVAARMAEHCAALGLPLHSFSPQMPHEV